MSTVKIDTAYNFKVTIKVNQINIFFSERWFNLDVLLLFRLSV